MSLPYPSRSPPFATRRPPEFAAGAAGALAPASRAGQAGRVSDAVVLWLLLAVVLLAPLPLGSNRPLPASALAAAVGILLCGWGAGRLLAPPRLPIVIRPFWPGIVLVSVAAAWAAVQALPFTPAALHHPYWGEARQALGLPYAGAISVNPEATRSRLLGLLAYGGIFWLALQLCRSGARAHQVLIALAAGGLLYALYGLFDAFRSGTGSVTSSFVNRNSYATYAGMTLLCALGLTLREFARRVGPEVSLRRMALAVLARVEGRLASGVITCLIIGTALLLTQSRGAFVALCAALVVFVWSLKRMVGMNSRTFFVATAACAVGLFLSLVALAGEATIGRFAAADLQAPHRLAYYLTTWQALWDRPLLGTGYGTYADAFKAYNHPGTGTYFLDKAHNTYLQLIMELGWPAAAALLAGLTLLMVSAIPRRSQAGPILQRRGAIFPAVLAACAALVAVHGLVDFSLEIPANAATFALLLGAGRAQAVRFPEPEG